MSHLRAALGLALLVGTGWLWAGEGGKRPTPPDAYSAVWPDENPLAKPGAKVPVPPIIWEKIKVRADHPRLLFSKETLPALRERLRGNPLWTTIKDAAAQGDPLACAFLHQIGGNPKYAEYAINVLLTATPARDAAFLYDWTYDAMTEQQKRDATERVWETCVALDRTTGWPRCSPYTAYPTDSRPSETAPADWPPYYNWTFHDQDWARHYAITFFGLVALAGHKARCEEGVRNFWEYSLKDPVLFFDYLRDGSYWQGDYWSPTARIQEIYRIYQTMKTACGVDAIDPKTHPWLGNFGRWLLYCSDTGKGLSDPGKGRVIFNYGDSIMQPLQTRQKTCLYASNSLVNNPHVEWLAQNSVPEPVFWLDEALYHDTKFKGTPPDNLPFARAFPGTGLAVMRSGWDAGAIWASFRWTDFFDLHGHNDAASFILYCRSPLVPDGGFAWEGSYHTEYYYRRAVAHNTLLVRDPARKETFPDGGQFPQPKRTWTFAVGRDAWVYNQDTLKRGDLLAFETKPLYDYCAGDAAKAYRAEEIKEFNRQVVFLRDGFVVIFDRVESTRPEIEKRWAMHLVGEPKIDGKLLNVQVKGHVEDYDGHLAVSVGKDRAIVRCHTLLPTDPIIRRIGGAMPDIPISALVRVPRSVHRMGTGSRWGWTDPFFLEYNDELTGKRLPFLCIERDSPTDATYEVNDQELYLKLDAYERGRVEEKRVKLADCRTLLDLARELGRANMWHSLVHYLPGYEYYNEGTNYAPAYMTGDWDNIRDRAPELLGRPNDRGSWRLEVRAAKPTTREYFLHVLHVLRDPDDPTGEVTCQDSPERAQATVKLGERTCVVSFPKTGELGGHIRITAAKGRVEADADFVRKIDQTE